MAGTNRAGDEREAASAPAIRTCTVTVGDELKSRIVPASANGQLHRRRLRFGSHLECDQGIAIPKSSVTHCVAVFERSREAESAIRELQGAGFDMTKLSVLGRGFDAEERAIGLNAARDDLKILGKEGTFWGGAFGALFWPAFFFIPGIGPVLTAGLIGSALIATVEAAAVGAAIEATASALVVVLSGWGIPKDAAIGYETDLKANRLLLIASGNSAELAGMHPISVTRGAKVSVHGR